MSTITFRRNLDSETLQVPELRSLVGHSVEIVVHDSQPMPGFDADRSALLQTIDEVYLQHAMEMRHSVSVVGDWRTGETFFLTQIDFVGSNRLVH